MTEITIIAKLSKADMKNIAEEVARINSAEEANTSMADKEYYSVNDVAKITNKTAWTVRQHIGLGLLIAQKVGKSFLINKNNLENYTKNAK
jgi:coproporphyrinogen III oxidase-like Fe-S oxidoreductase